MTPDNLRIAENAALILSLHRELDAFRGERQRGHADRHHASAASARPMRTRSAAARSASWTSPIRRRLPAKIDRLLAHHNALRRGLGARRDRRRSAHARRARRGRAARSCPIVDSVWSAAVDERRDGKRILFEGAQGALLDIDHGTYPFVTSSNTVAGQAAAGSGPRPGRRSVTCSASPRPIRRGSARGRSRPSRTTRSASCSARRGHEFGTVTGRKRRCGWFDAVLVRQTVADSGIDGIALTKLDVLDGLDEIKVCGGLPARWTRDRLPAGRPEGEQAPASSRSTRRWKAGKTRPPGARSWTDLPAQAVKYVRYIEELIGAPVALLSTSPEREDTILVHDPFQS